MRWVSSEEKRLVSPYDTASLPYSFVRQKGKNANIDFIIASSFHAFLYFAPFIDEHIGCSNLYLSL